MSNARPRNHSEDNQPTAGMILGEVAASGLARGRALLCDCAKQIVVPRRLVSESEAQTEVERFDHAVSASEKKLLEVQASVRRAIGNAEAEIFAAQISLMRDAQLRKTVREFCLVKRMNVEAALDEAIRHLIAVFDRFEDPYLRERGADLRDVGNRLLDQLTQQATSGIPDQSEGCVLVTRDLLASAVAQLKDRGVQGLIVEQGSLTSHAAILARTLGIPMLVHVAEATRKISANDRLIVDAVAGRAFINPAADIQRIYDRLEADLLAHQSALKDLIDLPAVTRDGVEIHLAANIDQAVDAVTAARVKADGAGLYRTEFVFFVQDHFPSEEEQYRFYRATAEQLQPAGTTIRVLDLGSDKPLDYFPLPRDANPALGCRSTRLLLAHPAILHAQLRAILRLSATHPVRILLPMISGLDDLRAVQTMIENVQTELAAENLPFNSRTPLGVMIETPAAAILIGQLADEVSFFNVGTNDLVQYLLAADRIGGDPASGYDPLHPAVLHVLASLTAAAESKDKPICLCGEIAGDPAYTALLLGLGFRRFSVRPGQILDIKFAIRSIRLSEAKELAGKALAARYAGDIRALVQDDWSRRRPVSPPEIRDPALITTEPLSVAHHAGLRRFESQAGDGPRAFLAYALDGNCATFDHTFVPDELRGHGVAARLVRAALDEARKRCWKVVPRCSYVAAFIARNPEFADLLEAPHQTNATENADGPAQ